MQVKVTLKADGVDQLIENKRRQFAAAKTTTLQQIGQEEVRAAQQRIRNSKTDPEGRSWQPWSMATLKQRRREGNANRGLLYRTGALLTSIKYRVDKGVLAIFTDVPYARYLQFGTPKMPARPFIGWGNRINSIITRLTGTLK